MATNLAIDPELLDQALRVGGLRTKKETVSMALREFVARRQQRQLLDLAGAVEWDDTYDHKADRRGRDDKHAS